MAVAVVANTEPGAHTIGGADHTTKAVTVQPADAPSSMIGRMTLILDAFDSTTPALSLVDLARRTGLPRSTAHRILDEMVRLRWIAHAPGGYRLGMRALELGGLAATHNEVRTVATPLLHEMCRRTGLAGHLAVLDGREVVYLDKVGGRRAINPHTRIGGRMPAHTTAVGKAILASLDPNNVDATFGAQLPMLTPCSIATVDALHRELDQVRLRRGIAVDREESIAGVACVAAPLQSRGPATAALSLCGDPQAATVEAAGRLVLEVAREAGRLWSHRKAWH